MFYLAEITLNKEVNAESGHWHSRHQSHFHFFFPPLLFSLCSTSSSLAFEISFLSNTNFKRRLCSSGSQINFTPHCNMKTSSYTHTNTQVTCVLIPQRRHGSLLIKHRLEVIKRSCGMIAIISLVKYQGTLSSKISSLFQAYCQY